MPWSCPFCQLPINHSTAEQQPRTGARYRCHICRLELALDEHTKHLVVAPIETQGDAEEPRRRRRRRTLKS